MKYIIWIVLGFIALYFIYYIFVVTHEYFTDLNTQISFLNQTQAIEFISLDPDGYVSRFNQTDFKARGIKSPQDYTDLYLNKVIIPSDKQITQIENAITQGFKQINQIDTEDKIWVDINKFKSIPWKFIIVNSKQIDYGLPHTRYDTIVLHIDMISDSKFFIDTLIHEQLHVYQKLYPEDFEKYLQANNFVRDIKYIDSNIQYRSNPDIDEWIYRCGGEMYYSEYNSSNPKSINEVRYYPSNSYVYEHPREKSVYNLLEKLKI